MLKPVADSHASLIQADATSAERRLVHRAERARRISAEMRGRFARPQTGSLLDEWTRLREQCALTGHALHLVEQERAELRAQLHRARKEERERIAQDLHDEVGQEIVAAMADLRQIRAARRGIHRDAVDAVIARLNSLGRNVHRAVVDGRPSILEELGLRGAIETTARAYASDAHVKVSVARSGRTAKPPPEVEIAFYRVAQEALTNAVRHARDMTRIDLRLEAGPQGFTLTVKDDGLGFDPTECATRPGIGIVGMRRRLAQVGGALEVISKIGEGTIVVARAPSRIVGIGS